MGIEKATCQRCGETIESYSPKRKWCFDCRKRLAVERQSARKRA